MEVIVDYAENNEFNLGVYAPANYFVNSFVKKYGDSMMHSKIVERANYIRFCCLRLDQSRAADVKDKLLGEVSNSTRKHQADYLSAKVIDEQSYAHFADSLIPSFKRYLEEKIAILQEDNEFENKVLNRFPNFLRNPYVKAYVESLFAIHAVRATYF